MGPVTSGLGFEHEGSGVCLKCHIYHDLRHAQEASMQQVGFVIFPNFQVMSFAAVSVFEMANVALGEPAYAVTLLSETGGLVRSSAGFSVETQTFARTRFDTVIIGASNVVEPVSTGLLEFVRRSMETSRRVAAPCTGAFVLAEAGVLEGRKVTTHWLFARELQARFPGLQVEEDRIYIVDGPVWTSAGMTAGIDLALAMGEGDHGPEVARSAARKLDVYRQRA